ncbi:MAG TPA: glycosyltransferase family 4 protein [Ruminococcus sp.]|nr:glycosyltransferase family 4 protein [Ruminococcus sp.]
MKILILANNDIGLYQFRKELIFELLKKHKVYISLPYGKLIEPLKKAGCKFIDTPLDRRGINPFTDLKLVKRYFSIISRLKPDLVITYTIKPNIYGGFACRCKKISYAENITGLGTAFESGGFLTKLVTVMYKVALGKAKVVFFENFANLKEFLDRKIIKKQQAKLLNGAGVNLEHYSYQEYPNNDIVKFLFVGRVMKEKGIDELFAAMKQLIKEGKSCFLDVVGLFEEDYKGKLEQYETEGWLKYHGYQEDVRPFIKGCDCFVLPSYHEGMANTNLECAASGRPVITSNIPGCKEAVIDGVSGLLCDSKSSKSLYQAMKRMVEIGKTERTTMGLAGRKHMEDVFDKKKVVRETISCLFLR